MRRERLFSLHSADRELPCARPHAPSQGSGKPMEEGSAGTDAASGGVRSMCGHHRVIVVVCWGCALHNIREWRPPRVVQGPCIMLPWASHLALIIHTHKIIQKLPDTFPGLVWRSRVCKNILWIGKQCGNVASLRSSLPCRTVMRDSMRIITQDTLAHAQRGLHLLSPVRPCVVCIQGYWPVSKVLWAFRETCLQGGLSGVAQLGVPWELRHCHRSSLRSGLFNLASSPWTLSWEVAEGWLGQAGGKPALDRAGHQVQKISRCVFGFLEEKCLGGCFLLQAFISAFPVLRG